jgi:glycosyltransferase involved in cell wall biosynthesis
MRIALINTFIPYIRGGAEIVVEDLKDQLLCQGHEVISFRLPFPESYEAQLVATIEASKLLCLYEFDRVIAFKFPAYTIEHQAKVIWLFHQFRQIYDLWDTEFEKASGPVGKSLKRIYQKVDNQDIPNSRHIFTIAQEVTNRLKKFNGIDSVVLPPPLKNHELYFSEKPGNYFFYPSRLTSLKRQHLAINAMRYVQSGVRLILAGVSEGDYLAQLREIVRKYRLEKSVEIKNEWITDEEKRKLIANSLGVLFVPYKEDYGLVSLEALYSSKPVITCKDSGGTGEFIENDVNGYIVEPDPKCIAQAMDALYLDKSKAERMGKAGLDGIIRRDITWPSTIRRLLS